jgi:hypothetical protein
MFHRLVEVLYSIVMTVGMICRTLSTVYALLADWRCGLEVRTGGRHHLAGLMPASSVHQLLLPTAAIVPTKAGNLLMYQSRLGMHTCVLRM